jgi:hypothetical protein
MESSYVMQLVEKIPNHACEGLREESFTQKMYRIQVCLAFYASEHVSCKVHRKISYHVPVYGKYVHIFMTRNFAN